MAILLLLYLLMVAILVNDVADYDQSVSMGIGFWIACIIIRVLLRPVIYVRLLMNNLYGKLISEYLSNYICFIALSVEMFSILFAHGLVKSVVTVLLVDTVVLIGILTAGITKMNLDPSLAVKE